MKGPNDFPAAHSMDTTWFAVDLNGHVAVFDSGEAGAVPSILCEQPGVAEVLRAELPTGPVVYRRWPAGSGSHVRVPGGTAIPPGSRLVARLADSPETRAAVAASGGALLGASEGIAAAWSQKAPERWEDWHRDAVCRGCFREYEPPPGGVFQYLHRYDGAVSGPYELCTAPAAPAGTAVMPPELLQWAVRFEGRFGDAERLQPAELWQCESWMPGWLALDGKTVRPFPGREEELAEVREDFQDEPDLEVREALALPPGTLAAPRAPLPQPPAHESLPNRNVGRTVSFGVNVGRTSGGGLAPNRNVGPTVSLDGPAPKRRPWWKLW